MRFSRVATLTAIALLAAGCVKFRPPALDEPVVVLERFLFCASVAQKEDWAEPGPVKASFTAGEDDQIFAFVGLRDLRGPHTLAWKWYGPDRKLARSPDAIRIGEEGKAFDSYIAWDAIAVTPERTSGAWTVAVFLDEALLASKRFEIKKLN